MKETLTKCDRCGKEYTPDILPIVEYHGRRRTSVKLIALVDNSNGDYVNITDVPVDLCLDCRRDFQAWFNMGAK